jgi:hypothetical protein
MIKLNKDMITDAAVRIANFVEDGKGEGYDLKDLILTQTPLRGLTKSQEARIYGAYKKELYSRY